jgi:hypothetical protein
VGQLHRVHARTWHCIPACTNCRAASYRLFMGQVMCNVQRQATQASTASRCILLRRYLPGSTGNESRAQHTALKPYIYQSACMVVPATVKPTTQRGTGRGAGNVQSKRRCHAAPELHASYSDNHCRRSAAGERAEVCLRRGHVRGVGNVQSAHIPAHLHRWLVLQLGARAVGPVSADVPCQEGGEQRAAPAARHRSEC